VWVLSGHGADAVANFVGALREAYERLVGATVTTA